MASLRSALLALLLAFACPPAAFAGGRLRVSARLVERGRTSRSLDQVISILMNMMSEFRRQESDDKQAWEGYSRWAEETETDRTEYVRTQEGIILSNTATLNARREEVSTLTSELSQLASDIASMKKSIQELTKMRREEHEQHAEALADLTKTITAVGRAIEILEGQYHAGGAALTEIKRRVQFAMTLTNGEGKNAALAALLQSNAPDWLNTDGSQYNSYQSAGGGHGVVQTLTDLRSTVEANRQQAIDTEATAVRDYEDTRAAKESEVRRMTTEQKEKTEQKADAEAAVTMAISAIDGATTNKQDALTYLEELRAERETFGQEYQGRCAMRSQEVSATQAALDALQSVSAGAKEGVGASASFFQASSSRTCVRCESEAKKLEDLAARLDKSPVLLQVAAELLQRTKAGYSPEGFEPVKQLLENLIARLEAEATAETSHHDWCESEKTSSADAQAEREAGMKELEGAIERLTTETSTLKTEVEFLMSEISRVEEENRAATENRNTAHEIFVAAKRDHDEVITAIETASAALGGQYGLVQVGSGAKASPFASYSSGASSGASAIEMLEDLLSRYSSARTVLVNDENTAKAAYDQLMETNRQFLADTTQTKNTKIAERRGKISQLGDDKAEYHQNYVELGEITKYLQDLRPSCDDIRTTFEERRRRREAEIGALRECLNVLSNPASMA